jgi:hypothetical protein
VLPERVAVDDGRIEVDLQRSDAGSQIDDAGQMVLFDPFVDDVGFEAELEVEVMGTEFNEEVAVAGAAEDDAVVAGAEGSENGRLMIED